MTSVSYIINIMDPDGLATQRSIPISAVALKYVSKISHLQASKINDDSVISKADVMTPTSPFHLFYKIYYCR